MAREDPDHKLNVVIAGGGVAALETALALSELAPSQTSRTLLTASSEFVYRPMTVVEPFAYPSAQRYSLAQIAEDAGAQLVTDRLSWVEPQKQVAHTTGGLELAYDALVVATGARPQPHYKHALTIDDRNLDETLHGLIQDIEEGYVSSLAFVAAPRMAWLLPLYELALMISGRAYDMNVKPAMTVVTPEDGPLAIFGSAVSEAVAELLRSAHVDVIASAYAEIPRSGLVLINPGDRCLHADRIIALPELYGPGVRGIPVGEHGFIRVTPYGQVPDAGPVYAAGDATAFALKHGGIAAQQADVAAESIAALAGAPVTPAPFHPVIHGILLTHEKPRYLTARITGGHGFSSQFTETPTWSPPTKIAARYLAPYLDEHDHQTANAR
ncbi:MAG TPA: FAD-dependent oxidoreductase [Solirubrobacteraceae bacterium]|jgi:sulfide:quinone oxidoreductase